jgi:primosomal protein N'
MESPRVVIHRCADCGSTDINYRVYGTNPEIVLVACFDCMKIHVMQYDHMYARIDLGNGN